MPDHPRDDDELPPLARRPLAAGLAVLGAAQIWAAGTWNGYGYHRDELYFLSAGRHPDWGYPDQPPFTPLLARATELVHAHQPTALRAPAVLMMLWVTLLAALMARELGGRAFAQLLAAFAVGTGTFVLVSGHLLATSTADFTGWVTLTWIALHALRTGRERWWLAFGAVLGIGLLNKQLPLFLVAAIGVGVVLTPEARPVLRSPWLLAGGLLAAAAWAPVLLWQARNGWPQLELAGQIRDEYGRAGERIGFAVMQLVLFSAGATVLWAVGLVRLFRTRGPAPVRALAWAWPALMVMLALTAGQMYYAAGIYPVLVAAGAVAVESHRRRGLFVVATAASALLMLPVGIPVLPPATLERTPWNAFAEQSRESVGWPELVAQVAEAHRALPPEQRASAVVVASNYGEAGALEEYGHRFGLPLPVHSGHNGFAAWGPPPEGRGPVLLVWQADPARFFTGCRGGEPVRTGVANEESESARIYVCDGPIGGWRAVWPRLTRLRA